MVNKAESQHSLMATVVSSRQCNIDELLLGTFLDPTFDQLSSEKLDEENDWNTDSFFTNSSTLHNEHNDSSSSSTWDAISAWLFNTENSSLEDVKQEPISPFSGSTSSISSENEVDEYMFSTQTSNYLDPELFLNQPTHNAGMANEIMQIDTHVQADDGIATVVNDSVHKEAGYLNETQLRVYQKFIPIKPKIENQDDEKKADSGLYRAKQAAPAIKELFQFKEESNGDRTKIQSKRKSRTDSDPEQNLRRKQKRMARNREAALQSRQKKKELMQTLEVRLNALSSMNSQLKVENDVLKEKIKQLENENVELRHRKQIDVPDLAKKTSCVLVLFVFLAINVKPLSNMSSKLHDPSQFYQASVRHGRNLLEYDRKTMNSEQPVYQNIVYNKDETRLLPSEALMDILDRKVLRKIRRLYKLQGMVKQERLALAGSEVRNKANETNDDCSLSFNRTEVYRLNEALEKLVKVHKKKGKKLKKMKNDLKKVEKVLALKNFLHQSVNCTSEQNSTSNCSRKFSPRMIALPRKESRQRRIPSNDAKLNQVQTFQYDWSAFERFQKSINRQPNTFYFVSFKKDHIFLPPLQYNETQRPRVSFILPNSNSTHSIWNSTGDKVSLMQIDCQVMDTKIFHILKSNIPRYNLPLSSFFLRNT